MSYPTRKNQILACIGAWSKFLFSSVFIHAVCGNFSAAQCTKSGPNDGSTFVTDNSNGGVYNYTNPSNAQLSDNNRANAASIAGIFTRKTYYLQVTGFNFNVPATATICGVEVEIQKRAGSLLSTAAVNDDEVKLIKTGAITGANRAAATAWTGADGYSTYGSSGDLWGTTLTPGDLNAANLGVTIAAKITSLIGVAPSAEVNHVRLSVYYNVPLPVTLEYFKVAIENSKVKLEWKMDYNDERNVTIQRSSDALTWDDIHAYQLDGFATTNYFQYYDPLTKPGKYYYRLMFTSFTGQQEYSLVKTLDFEPDRSPDVFPVPSTSTVFLKGAKGTTRMVVTDLSQRRISIPIERRSDDLVSINISSLPRGIYFIQIGTSVRRIIKN